MARRRGFVFGDLHFPWHDIKALAAAMKRLEQYKPDYVVQVGDLYDMYSFNRFGRNHNLMTPQQEMEQAEDLAIEFWEFVQSATPRKCEYYQLAGNHDIRPSKKIIQSGPEFAHIVNDYFKSIMSFSGVKTIYDPRKELHIDDVCFIHGYKTKLGDHMMESHENLVHGHTHRGGTMYHPWGGKIVAELDVGFLGDRNAEALSYTARKKFSKWTPGWGEIDEWGFRFVAAYQ